MTDTLSEIRFPDWYESERSYLSLGRRLSFSEQLDLINDAFEAACRL